MQNDIHDISVSPESLKRRHESPTPSIRNVVVSAVLIVVMILMSFGAVEWMMSAFASQRPMSTRPPADIVAPDSKPIELTVAPHLQLNENVDLIALRTREEEGLNSYGWIDQTAGVVRIPIERAMDLIVARGLPETNVVGQSDLELIRERSQSR